MSLGDEEWLREHKLHYTDASEPVAPKTQTRPLTMSNTLRRCDCGHDAVVELFRDGKCLACQAADYLGPLK
jgi:hypothetical protein